METKIKKLEKSQVEIESEINAETFEKYWEKAIKKIGEKVEIDGFRKGKIPENVLLSKIPEIQILEEMAEMALSEEYPKILEGNKIDAIGRPEISITKLARKNPLAFKIKTAILPEVKLPDYKTISKKVVSEITEEEKNFEPTEEEIENTIMDIRKSRAPKIHMTDTVKEHEHKDGETCEHENKESVETKEPELPEFNDDFVRALGPFENVDDFKVKLKENMKLEKENGLKEKTRLKIVEKIVEKMQVELPEILVEVELDKILYRMESDISAMGLKFEDYLKHLQKNVEDLRKDFRADAEKKAKFALAMSEIAKTENITADKEQLEKEVTMILEHYKDADPNRARMHAENVLTNEKIFQFLEEQK